MPAKGEKAEEKAEKKTEVKPAKAQKEEEGLFGFASLKLIKYAAMLAIVLGIIVGLTNSIGYGHMAGPQRFAMFLDGLLQGIIYGGIILALHEIVARRK